MRLCIFLLLKFHFKVLTFSQAFVHKALRPKISTNFDDIDTLEVSKIIFVNFCIHFCKYFLSLYVSQKFLTHKRKKKNRKNNLFFGKDFTWFLTKKKNFSIFFDFFSKTSIMEAVYINVQTWILHQFGRLYAQNFRFYPYFINLIKKSDFVCFPYFYGIVYIYNIQKMMTFIYIKKYSWETDKLNFFL